MVSSTARQIISLAISLLIVVISLTDVAQGAPAPDVRSLTSGPNGNGRYTPGFAGAPGKMARDAAGNFYVADFWAKGIVKLDRQLGNKGFIPTSGRPTAVAVLADNRLVVAMAAPQAKVAFYTQAGQLPNVSGEETGTFENPAPTLYRPSGITVDDDGYIYVLDAGDSSDDLINNVGKIRVYGPNNGTYRDAIGTRTGTYLLATTYDTRLKQPAGIAYEKVGHKIVVADTMNGRLLFFLEYNGTSNSMAAVSFIGKSAAGGGTGSPPTLGSTPVTFGNPVDVAFEYDAVPTLQRIYVAERARNEISVLDATTNLSTKYINSIISGATLKLPNSVLFEKTATGGVLYANNAATSTPADILSLAIDLGTIPGTGATLTINAIDPTSTSSQIEISGTNSGAFAVSCRVNGGEFFTASGTTSWSFNNPNYINLVTGNNHILCKTDNGTVTSFAEAVTHYTSTPDPGGPTVTIAGPSTIYSKYLVQTISGTTGVANAFVKVEGNRGGICNTTSNSSSNWACTLTLPAGEVSNLLTASAWKTGTTVKTATATVVVDLTDPDMTVTGKISFVSDVDTEVDAPTTTNAVQNLDGIVFDANLSSVEVNGVAVPAAAKVTLSGTNTYFSTPVTLIRGLNTVTVTATDLAGRSTTLSLKVTLNPEIKGFTIALPADNSYKAAGVATASGTVDTAFTSVNAAGTVVAPTDGNWSTAAMTVATNVFGSYKFTASGGGNATVTEKRTINSGAAYTQLAITSPAADLATFSPFEVISGSVAAGTLDAPTISVNGAATISDSSYDPETGIFSHKVTFPAQGTYSVKIAANAATTAIRNIIYDANPTELTLQADSKQMPAIITGAIEPNVRISAITASLKGTAVVIPLSVITFAYDQASGSVVWHANLTGYEYDTIKFTATNPAGKEKELTRKALIPTGDIDGDGAVRLSDALAALRHVAGTELLILDTPKFLQADVGSLVEGHAGQDDVVDITDAVLILNKSYGLLSF